MRNLVAKLFFGAALISIAVSASAADNSLGTWKLNMTKSRFTPTAPVKALTSTREASDGGVKVTTTGEQADGTAINTSYIAKYDGKYRGTSRVVISKDGKTMINTTRGTNADGKASSGCFRGELESATGANL